MCRANASYSASNGKSLHCITRKNGCSLVTCTPPPGPTKPYDSSNAVAHSAEALRYKQGSRRFDSRWRHSGADTAANIHEYQEYFVGGKGGRCVGLTIIPPSYANCLEIWEPTTGIALPFTTVHLLGGRAR